VDGQQEGHLACKNLCYKTPWDGGVCKWMGYTKSTIWVQRVLVCPVRMLRISIAGGLRIEGALLDEVLLRALLNLTRLMQVNLENGC